MNRKERRNLKKEINIFSDVIKILKQYFPKLVDKFEKLTDTRHQSYIEYQMFVITITRLLGLLCGIKSMRNTTEKLNTEETIKNISNVLGIELEEIPHYDTINKEANVIKYQEKKKEIVTEFMWITSFKITEKNKKELLYYGRQRWKIENEGFNLHTQ